MHGVQAPGNSRSPQSGRCRHITLRRDINADGGISFHPDYPRQCAVFSRDGTVNLLQLPNILPNLRRRSRKDQEAAVPMIRRRKRRDDEGSFKKLFSIPSAIMSGQWSPNGHLIAVSSRDNCVRVIKARGTPATVLTLSPHQPSAASCVRISPDNRHLLSTGGDRTVRLYDMHKRSEICALKGHNDYVSGCDFLHSSGSSKRGDGNLFVSCSIDQTVRVWDIRKRKAEAAVLKGHSDWVMQVMAHPCDGYIVASSSHDRSAVEWCLRSLSARMVMKHHQHVVSGVTFAPNNRLITSSLDGTLAVWNRDNGAVEATLSRSGVTYFRKHNISSTTHSCCDGHTLKHKGKSKKTKGGKSRRDVERLVVASSKVPGQEVLTVSASKARKETMSGGDLFSGEMTSCVAIHQCDGRFVVSGGLAGTLAWPTPSSTALYWAAKIHRKLPRRFRSTVELMLFCRSKQSLLTPVPLELMFEIFQDLFLMFLDHSQGGHTVQEVTFPPFLMSSPSVSPCSPSGSQGSKFIPSGAAYSTVAALPRSVAASTSSASLFAPKRKRRNTDSTSKVFGGKRAGSGWSLAFGSDKQGEKHQNDASDVVQESAIQGSISEGSTASKLIASGESDAEDALRPRSPRVPAWCGASPKVGRSRSEARKSCNQHEQDVMRPRSRRNHLVSSAPSFSSFSFPPGGSNAPAAFPSCACTASSASSSSSMSSVPSSPRDPPSLSIPNSISPRRSPRTETDCFTNAQITAAAQQDSSFPQRHVSSSPSGTKRWISKLRGLARRPWKPSGQGQMLGDSDDTTEGEDLADDVSTSPPLRETIVWQRLAVNNRCRSMEERDVRREQLRNGEEMREESLVVRRGLSNGVRHNDSEDSGVFKMEDDDEIAVTRHERGVEHENSAFYFNRESGNFQTYQASQNDGRERLLLVEKRNATENRERKESIDYNVDRRGSNDYSVERKSSVERKCSIDYSAERKSSVERRGSIDYTVERKSSSERRGSTERKDSIERRASMERRGSVDGRGSFDRGCSSSERRDSVDAERNLDGEEIIAARALKSGVSV